jgi:aspartate racemase
MQTLKTSRRGELLGVVGGVGPLASAEFLKTIYERNLDGCEQMSPRVLLYSDPTFPDRTETLLAGLDDLLLARLVEAIDSLDRLGASRIVVCCVTLHHLLPRLPPSTGRRVWSLIDVVFEQLLRSQKRHLLFCTNGTRKLQIFERHRQWTAGRDFLALPDEADQRSIHDLIYRIKSNHEVSRLIPNIEALLSKYGVDSFVAGCTEIHLLAKRFAATGADGRERGCIDPLTIIAKEVTKESLCNT